MARDEEAKAMSHQPVEVRLHEASGFLEVHWGDGEITRSDAVILREACRCSGCEHRRRQGNPVEAEEGIALVDVEPMGGSGLHLSFSDGHTRGLYPWPYLRELGTTAFVEQEG